MRMNHILLSLALISLLSFKANDDWREHAIGKKVKIELPDNYLSLHDINPDAAESIAWMETMGRYSFRTEDKSYKLDVKVKDVTLDLNTLKEMFDNLTLDMGQGTIYESEIKKTDKFEILYQDTDTVDPVTEVKRSNLDIHFMYKGKYYWFSLEFPKEEREATKLLFQEIINRIILK